MKVYLVGPDDPGFSEEENGFVWVVCWYETGYYEGDGESVAFGNDGLLHFFKHGHCSCYGPLDDFGIGAGDATTVEYFLRERKASEGYAMREEIEQKVLELLG